MARLTAEKIAGGTKTVNGELLVRAIRHSVYLERLKTSEVRRVLGFVNQQVLPDLVDKFEVRLRRIAARRDYVYNAATLRRMQDAVTEFYMFFKEGMKQVKGDFRGTLRELGRYEAEFSGRLLNQVTSPFDVSFTFPTVRVLDKLANNAIVRGDRVDKWFDAMTERTRTNVARAINTGVATGEGIDKIVRGIRGTRAAGYEDGILNDTRRNIEANVRTSINGVMNEAREETYAENADVISGVQYVATLDNRTTEICASLDGQVFPVGEGPRPPQHFNCRSTTIPVLKSWKELGINLRESPSSTRSAMGGQVSAKLTYPEWLKGQPKSVQDDVLGKGKAELFRSGKVSFDRFVSDGKSLTLAEVKKREEIT